MHREILNTLVLGALALLLVVLVYVLAPTPDLSDDTFTGEGQAFFPELTQADMVHGLEVRVFDISKVKVENFRVEETADGKWVIPSHHNYPADAKEELGKVVLSFMGLKKDRLVAQAVGDHEKYGVLDPDDSATQGVGGRGRKIIFRDQNGKVVAQYIFGKKVNDLDGQYYVRIPEEKWVYAVKFEPHISTQFGDWINPDLLQIHKDEIAKIFVNNYSINEDDWPQKLSAVPHDQFTLSRLVDKDHPAPGELVLEGLSSQEEMNKTNLDELLNTLTNLKIVGVRSIQEYFQTEGVLMGEHQPMRGAGYFIDKKQLYSNEGDVTLFTQDGLSIRLAFGELTGGVGEALTAGVNAREESELSAKPGDKKWDNRYLWIIIGYTGAQPKAGEPEPAGLKRAKELNDRFGQYFYVISDENIAKLHRSRTELTQKKVAPATPAGEHTPPGPGPAIDPNNPTNPNAPIPAHPPQNGDAHGPTNEVIPATPPTTPPASPANPGNATATPAATPPASPPASPPATPPAEPAPKP